MNIDVVVFDTTRNYVIFVFEVVFVGVRVVIIHPESQTDGVFGRIL